MGPDHRRFPRLAIRLLTWVRITGSAQVVRALTKDISSGGLCLLAEEALPQGIALALEISLPDREQTIACTAEVAWSRSLTEAGRSGAHQAEVGVRFLDISPSDHKVLVQFARLNSTFPT